MALGYNRDDILNLFYENIRYDLTSEDEWKTKFLVNIINSEEKHMDAVKKMLIKYNIEFFK